VRVLNRVNGLRLRAALALACVETLAFAGPPFVTDDPEPAAFRTWEVNYAANGTLAGISTQAYVPGVDINYGASPGVQLHAQVQMAYASDSTGHRIGPGDIELGVKYRLTPETQEDEGWMVSVYPLLELPTGDAHRALGAGHASALLPLWVQRTLGAWTMYGGGGYWVNQGAGRRNAWAAGWVVLYQWNAGWQLGGEVFGKTSEQAGAPGSSGFNLGGTCKLSEDKSLLFSAGRGLSHVQDSNRASAYLGLQVIY